MCIHPGRKLNEPHQFPEFLYRSRQKWEVIVHFLFYIFTFFLVILILFSPYLGIYSNLINILEDFYVFYFFGHTMNNNYMRDKNAYFTGL